jgi:hypothetical protein
VKVAVTEHVVRTVMAAAAVAAVAVRAVGSVTMVLELAAVAVAVPVALVRLDSAVTPVAAHSRSSFSIARARRSPILRSTPETAVMVATAATVLPAVKAAAAVAVVSPMKSVTAAAVEKEATAAAAAAAVAVVAATLSAWRPTAEPPFRAQASTVIHLVPQVVEALVAIMRLTVRAECDAAPRNIDEFAPAVAMAGSLNCENRHL